MKRVLVEALLVAVAGAALAFAANALSPRGLKLTRDYYLRNTRLQTNAAPAANLAPAAEGGTNAPTAVQLLAARLREKGLGLAGSNRVVELFQDPRRQLDGVVFVDARNNEHYQAGHIPGAYEFDYYHPESYINSVMQVCQIAQQVVVYCNGGECEDSELAATLLCSLGIPKEKLLVYGGGYSEWRTNGQPIELGQRNSGKIQTPKK